MNTLVPFYNFTNRTYLCFRDRIKKKNIFNTWEASIISSPVTNPPGVATILTSNRADGFSLFRYVMYMEAFSVNCIWLP